MIGGHAALLDGLELPAGPRDEVRQISAAADRAAALTRRLFAFSRKSVLRPRAVDLNAVVEGVQRMLRRLIGASIEIDLQLDRALPAVRADPGQIEQVIVNFVLNARDALPQGGTIEITTACVELAGGGLPSGS